MADKNDNSVIPEDSNAALSEGSFVHLYTGGYIDTLNHQQAQSKLKQNDLKAAIIKFFDLHPKDAYIYHAIASVTLSQAQTAVEAGAANGLHDWYLDDSGKPAGHPSSTDIQAYIALFDPSRSPANSLKGFAANAKKDSIRASVAQHLLSKRHLDPSITVPKNKRPFPNPYFDFWAWSCLNLEYAGPNTNTVHVQTSHHILPVFMHHFGCVCPSYESLEIISRLANGRVILDIGSGNGYWTLMLRRQGCQVVAVDNQQSVYRSHWIADTVKTDGLQFLRRRHGAPQDVLLLVYPVVAADFTRKIVDAYKGVLVCVVGTQNGNGYTAFKDVLVDDWMRSHREEFDKIVQVPLPSFAGKDEALFVFRKRK